MLFHSNNFFVNHHRKGLHIPRKRAVVHASVAGNTASRGRYSYPNCSEEEKRLGAMQVPEEALEASMNSHLT